MAVEPRKQGSRKPDDFEAHVRDYAGFTKLFTYGAIVCLVDRALRHPDHQLGRSAGA